MENPPKLPGDPQSRIAFFYEQIAKLEELRKTILQYDAQSAHDGMVGNIGLGVSKILDGVDDGVWAAAAVNPALKGERAAHDAVKELFRAAVSHDPLDHLQHQLDAAGSANGVHELGAIASAI